MNRRIRFYRLCRQVSIAIMAASVAVVLTTTFISDTPYAKSNSSLTRICSYKDIHFCLVIPSDGSAPFTITSHGIEPSEGST